MEPHCQVGAAFITVMSAWGKPKPYTLVNTKATDRRLCVFDGAAVLETAQPLQTTKSFTKHDLKSKCSFQRTKVIPIGIIILWENPYLREKEC